VIRELKKQQCDLIIDDDGKGEAADVVAVRLSGKGVKRTIDVELYHCKYSLGAPRARIDDLYVVCGQAQKSVRWVATDVKKVDSYGKPKWAKLSRAIRSIGVAGFSQKSSSYVCGGTSPIIAGNDPRNFIALAGVSFPG
jgi:hypothetical protein